MKRLLKDYIELKRSMLNKKEHFKEKKSRTDNATLIKKCNDTLREIEEDIETIEPILKILRRYEFD